MAGTDPVTAPLASGQLPAATPSSHRALGFWGRCQGNAEEAGGMGGARVPACSPLCHLLVLGQTAAPSGQCPAHYRISRFWHEPCLRFFLI